MSAARSAVWVAFVVLAMPLLGWVKGSTAQDSRRETNGALPARPDPVDEDPVAAEVEIRAPRLAQPQVREVGAWQRVPTQVELADRPVFDPAEAGRQPRAGHRRRRADRDEVALMHEPGV